MGDLLKMDSHLYETYQQRMAEIQDVSDVIAVANMQLNKILTQFNWTKQSLRKKNEEEKEKCPLDENHRVKKENLHAHAQICALRQHNIAMKRKDVQIVSRGSTASSAPLFVSKAQYRKCGVDIGDGEDALNDDILENDDGINCYKPCNSLDELRFIYSWHKIPRNYVILDITKIPRNEIHNWLIENISEVKLDSYLQQGFINSMLVWLNEFPTPIQILGHVKDLLGDKSRSFILMLWKFLAAKCLCLNQQIPEHTRNEFDHYTSTSMKNQAVPVEADHSNSMVRKVTIENFITPTFSMNILFSHLGAEQKLNIYNDICKMWYFIKKPVFGINELKLETQAQEKLLTEFDETAKGQKTHWEILAELRDYKRRRQAYRGKNKSKFMSTLDIVRELLNQQMLYLKLTNDNKRVAEEKTKIEEVPMDEKTPDDEKRVKSSRDDESDRRRSSNRGRDARRNRSRSRERRRSRSRDERSRSRSRERNRSKHGRHRDRSRDRGRDRDRSRDRSRERSRRRDSRERSDVVSNKTYY